ncbi:alanine racemase [Xylanibacillus composti]|uniref:Alanine racemase n=1 Tax=Xylanibacillus composti TaxID=1572762 RepID=A0A8J4H915_9BACL|nr:alanine racemase [Xylanibacillus composti]MDT9723718.1 alanine racemase [Xylanibacillus composti]GIQ71378.1 alanine racemase [Xylanibacillus composti]
MDPYFRPTRVEISLDALEHNYMAFRRTLPDSLKIMAVVKANAYGHGAVEIAKEAVRCGADYLGVAILDEAIELRNAGIKAPLLVLGYSPPEAIETAVKHDITLTVYTDEMLEAVELRPNRREPLKIHIKLDTGMGRLGLAEEEMAVRFITRAMQAEGVTVEGLFTHYAKADEADKRYTLMQHERIRRIVAHFEGRGIRFPLVHAGNSAAAIDTPELSFNMIRLGISLYGLYPSAEVNRTAIQLEPVMSFKTGIVMVKTLPPGSGISYGCVYHTKENEQIVTLPVGYADGFTRMLSGKAEVLIRGKRVPVVGRICMDQCVVNASELPPLRLGEEVVLIGRQGDHCITADELADMLGTINYEITCMVANRVPKVYVRGGKTVTVSNPLLH